MKKIIFIICMFFMFFVIKEVVDGETAHRWENSSIHKWNRNHIVVYHIATIDGVDVYKLTSGCSLAVKGEAIALACDY